MRVNHTTKIKETVPTILCLYCKFCRFTNYARMWRIVWKVCEQISFS